MRPRAGLDCIKSLALADERNIAVAGTRGSQTIVAMYKLPSMGAHAGSATMAVVGGVSDSLPARVWESIPLPMSPDSVPASVQDD